jgi:DNA replication and repair protein RecF
MTCQKIKIKNFRNIERAEVEFSDGVNLLIGANAQGKTNLLEAIGYVALGKSFRTSHDEELIRFGEDMTELSVDFTDAVRDQNVTVRLMRGKRRRVEHNRVKVDRLSDAVGLLRTVLFCPEHLSMIKDGPSERRNFLDVALSQLYPVYLKSLQRYQQILKQRNQLIKNAPEDRKTFNDTVEFWSRQLAAEASLISGYRAKYVTSLSKHLKVCFSEMMGDRESPSAVYESSSKLSPDEVLDGRKTEEAYFSLLMNNHEREIGAGSTLWGIHKDDVDIRINDTSARSFASQGQQRSLVLAMKIAEGEICREICHESPVLLFDDVFSELDATRRAYLAERIRERQVIITTCEPSLPVGGERIYVEAGVYTKR